MNPRAAPDARLTASPLEGDERLRVRKIHITSFVCMGSLVPSSVAAQYTSADVQSHTRQVEDESARASERAASDAYCDRTREASKSTASVLLGPRIGVSGLKFPQGGDLQIAGITTSTPTSTLYQVRGYASWSLTDAYRGLLSLELGNLDCQRQRLAQPIQDAVRVAANQGRRSALAEQISFLDSAEPSILEIEKNAEARRGAGVITGAELEEIRSLGTSLRISRLQATDTLAQLEATPLPDPTNRVSADADRYSKAAMDYERLDSRIRRVTPWGFSVTGGAASNVLESSSIRTVDWFGTVEMSYNFGGIPQVTAERAALEARQRELEASPTELLQSARALDASLERSLAALHAQIELLSESERSVREQIAVLEKAEVADQTHLISVLKLRSIALQSQLVYLRALVERRRAWEPTHEQ